LQDLGRGVEAEGLRIADVELEDPVSLGLQLGGSCTDGAADVVQDIPQLLRLAHDGTHALHCDSAVTRTTSDVSDTTAPGVTRSARSRSTARRPRPPPRG